MSGVRSMQREELRIAVAMNGGVSLAVWMGGATLELYRLARAEGPYAELLAKTRATALVDVISGTSAGGLNGAFLAAALVHGTDLRALRDMWIATGSFAKLLRDPLREPTPASLLKGDAFFLPELRKVFAQLAAGELIPPHDAPLDLTLTATQLVGRRERLADDFGTVIEDVDHKTRFQFRRGPGLDTDSFAHPRLVDHLSVAARSSASFPGAFEASWIPMDDEAGPGGKPGMREVVGETMKLSGFVVDGGVLDNKPVEAAIEGVRRQRVGQRFRRVLLYIVPDPGELAVATEEGPPTLASVVWSSLVSIPRNESVIKAFREARDENRRAEEAIVARLSLASTQNDTSLAQLAVALFETYTAVRRDRSVRYVVDQISQGVAQMTGVGVAYGGQSERMRRSLMNVTLPWIPERTDDLWNSAPDSWGWGLRPAAEGLLLLSDALRWAGGLDYGDTAPDFSDMWGRYFAVREAARGDQPDWQAVGRRLATEGAAELDFSEVLSEWAAQPTALPGLGVDVIGLEWGVPEDGATTRTRRAAWLTLETASTIGTVAAAARGARDGSDAAMSSLLELLAPNDASDMEVMERLLQFHVVMSALGRGPEQTGQVIELMQVSAVTPDPFDPQTTVDVAGKLAGAQLGHFGAFYKRSWRANDWLQGRMDAAVRLTQLILSPAALRRVFATTEAGGSSGAIAWLREIANAPPGSTLARAWERDSKRISAELAFLDDHDAPAPDGLPFVVAAVARRLHAEIAAEELSTVARAAELDAEEGSVPGSRSIEFLEAYRTIVGGGSPIRRRTLSQTDALALLPQCRIGGEKVLSDDLGTDRFATTMTTTLAVSIAAAQAKTGGLGPLGAALRITRAPILILHLLVRHAVSGTIGQVITSVAATFALT
ncbi:MAG: patatin-like protein, partial [Gaiellales bacterium]